MKTVHRNSCSRAVGVGLAILAAFCIFSRNAPGAADGAPSAGGRIDTEEIRAGLERHAAYSSLAAGRSGTPSEGWIYLQFEGGPSGPHSDCQIARFNLSWVLGGEKTGDGEVPG